MKPISFTDLIQNNNYYIQHNEIKYIGMFYKLHDYNYFQIAEFKDTIQINSLDQNKTKIPKYFIVNNYYLNSIHFYIPEVETLLLEQLLRQKINDRICAHMIAIHF